MDDIDAILLAGRPKNMRPKDIVQLREVPDNDVRTPPPPPPPPTPTLAPPQPPRLTSTPPPPTPPQKIPPSYEKLILIVILGALFVVMLVNCMMLSGVRKDMHILMGQVQMMHQIPLRA